METKGKTKIEATLCIKDQWGTSHDVMKLETNHAEKILGVYQAPANNGDKQMRALRHKADQWMGTFKLARLGKGTAWHAINSRIMKGLEWPTAATTLSKNNAKK